MTFPVAGLKLCLKRMAFEVEGAE